jgi:predicted CopG family antitoxin
MMTNKKLLKLKEEIESAKSTISELTGEKKALFKTLKNDFGCSTIEEAQDKVIEIEKGIKKLEKTRSELVDKLEAAHEDLQ